MQSMLARYNRLLITDPYKTKMITSGVVFAGGDILCQLFFNKTEDGQRKPFDWKRFIKFTTIGTFYVAPVLHNWFGFVSKFVATRFGHLSKSKQALIMMGLDQTVFTLPYNFILLAGIDYLDQGDVGKSVKKVSAMYPTFLVNNWLVWPPAVLINYRFIPNQYRVLYANTLGLFWNIYVSYAANSTANDQKAQLPNQEKQHNKLMK